MLLSPVAEYYVMPSPEGLRGLAITPGQGFAKVCRFKLSRQGNRNYQSGQDSSILSIGRQRPVLCTSLPYVQKDQTA